MYDKSLEEQIIDKFNIKEYELKALDALVWELFHGPLYLVDEADSVFNDFEFEYEGKEYFFGDYTSESANGEAFTILQKIVSKFVDGLEEIYVNEDRDYIFEREPEGEWDMEWIREDLEELKEHFGLDDDSDEDDIIEFLRDDWHHSGHRYWHEEEYYEYDTKDILSEFIGDRAAREIFAVL